MRLETKQMFKHVPIIPFQEMYFFWELFEKENIFKWRGEESHKLFLIGLPVAILTFPS